MSVFLEVLFGFIGGIFGGLGMGGGTLLIPLLTIFLGFEQKLSQGINLISFLVMAIFSLFIHFKNGLIVRRGIGWIIAGGVVMTIVGSLLAVIIDARLLRRLFGAFLCILSIDGFIKVFNGQKTRKNQIKKGRQK